MVISIHQNSYHEEAIRGGQVFYYKTSVRGKKLAQILQERFDYVLGDANKRQAKANDNYYLLLHVKEPIVIAECGFLFFCISALYIIHFICIQYILYGTYNVFSCYMPITLILFPDSDTP